MLRSIRFTINLSDDVTKEPDLKQRHIMFEIFDGEHWSEPAFATVTIEPVNDNPPSVQVTTSGEVCHFHFVCSRKVIDLSADLCGGFIQ